SRARRAGAALAACHGERVAFVDVNSEALPIALFGAALANKPFVPINYRLTDEQLRDLVRRTAPATVVVGEGIADRLGALDGIELLPREELLELAADATGSLADLEGDAGGLPSLRALSYGGGPMPVAVIERAMRVLPHVDCVNAYGLTETSSTIALLGPDDHRAAFASDDPTVRTRLGSVGMP